MKTCKDIKREREQAWHAMEDKYHTDIFEAREREFPIGTKVSFEHGHGVIEAVVTQHGVYNFNTDKVTVKNVKSGKTHEKAVWELTALPPEPTAQEKTHERLKRERV